MLTIFSTPKAWKGHINTIQVNALKNWKDMDPSWEIILFGDDEGTAAAAKKFGVRHHPKIKRTEKGTPIISDIFKTGANIASNDTLAYINTDIIFVRGFPQSVKYSASNFDKFLMIGSRFNIDVNSELPYENGWEFEFEKYVVTYGYPHPGLGVDYFVFKKGQFLDIPEFALGRGFWDTWLIKRAIEDKHVTTINSTDTVFAAHQDHDYNHLPVHVPKSRRKWYSKGEETNRNAKLRGGDHAQGCNDTEYKLYFDPECGSLMHMGNK